MFYDVVNNTGKRITLDVGTIEAGATKTLKLTAAEVTAYRAAGMTVTANNSAKSAFDTDGREVFRDDATGRTVVTKTAAYTLLPADSGSVIVYNSASDGVLTAPPNLPVGFNVTVIQAAAGQASVATSGTGAVRPATSAHTGTAAQYSRMEVLVYANADGISAQVSISGNTATVS